MRRTNLPETVIALSLVCLLSAAAGCARPPLAATGPEVAVATYNVNYGMPRAFDAVAAIRATDADLVCLQETSPDWELLLRSLLSDVYPHMMFKHYGAAGGQAILSKAPFEEIAYEKPSAGWFPGWAVRARTALGDIQVLNVHLRPPLREDGRISTTIYFKSRDTRRSEIESLYAHIDPEQPALVMGDFNEGDTGLAVSFLAEKKFSDALPQFDRGAKTWRWRVGLITLTDRFDHIIHSAHLECLHARVLNRGASDHLPVVARFQRKTDIPR
jgi:endonuclease/exonuclease/phosphatase family metal-dependent hydrolase